MRAAHLNGQYAEGVTSLSPLWEMGRQTSVDTCRWRSALFVFCSFSCVQNVTKRDISYAGMPRTVYMMCHCFARNG